MPKKENYIRKSLTGGFALSLKNIIYIAAYWIIITFTFYLLSEPFAATVNEISGSSDISADAGRNPDIKGYFLIDMLPDLTDRLATALNPALLISGFLIAFAVGVFFTGGFLEVFKRALPADSDGRITFKRLKAARAGDFARGGCMHFLTMLLFFLLAVTAFLLLNTITSSVGRFLKAVSWGMTESEAAAYYTGFGVRIVYYALFLYLALILQYARIAAVFANGPPEGIRLSSVMQFKEGLWHGYSFLSENKLKATCLFLIILVATAVWFVFDHLIFFQIAESGSFDPLIWSAFTGFGYIFFRITQYAVASLFFRLRSDY